MLARHFEDPLADRYDHSGFFGNLYERVRRDQTVQRMSPADQRLKFADAAIDEVYDRLIKDIEFISFDGVSEIGLKLQHIQIVSMHFPVKDLVSRFSGLFSAIHRRIGVAEKVV